MYETGECLFSDMVACLCPKGNSFGHYESRAADLDCGDSEVGERCFVRFGLEVALRGPRPAYLCEGAASGTGVDSPVSRCSNAIEQRCVPEFEWCCACGRARSDVADRAAETAPARDAPVCSYCLSQRNDPTLSSVPWCSLIYACTFSGDVMKKTYGNTSRIAGHNHRGFSVCLCVILNLYVFCVH